MRIVSEASQRPSDHLPFRNPSPRFANRQISAKLPIRKMSAQGTEKVLVAMSGGVDSSVAALLLERAGVPIEGAYMKNWINEENIVGDCPWQTDIEDARSVAGTLGIPFRVVNLMREYRARVVDYLLAGYQSGVTPNPDVMCNREMKFGVFLEYARQNGFTAVATGHHPPRVPPSNARCDTLE